MTRWAKNRQERLRELQEKAWQADAEFGPEDNENPSLTRAEIAEYRDLVVGYKRFRRYARTKIRLANECSDNLRINRKHRCEHCLRRRSVTLITPGVVSGSVWGDWVCGACDGRVATMMDMVRLQRLVAAE